MGRISASVELPAAPDKVWAEFSNPNNFEKWLTIHTKWKGDVPAEFSQGSQVSEVVTMLGMATRWCRGAKMTGYEGLTKGTRTTVFLECRTDSGELVNEQYVTFFVRGFDTGEKRGSLGPSHRFDESLRAQAPIAKVSQHVDDDQTFRYGPAAGDPMPIHLDIAARLP